MYVCSPLALVSADCILFCRPSNTHLNHTLSNRSTIYACWSTLSARRLYKTAFLSPPWRNTLILITASILIYPYLPSPSKQSLSPSLSPDALQSASTPETPMITRLLAKYTPNAQVTAERNDKHLELSTEKAGERLLFQEAERPRVHRMRFPR
jgi:hypothetical protein